jgi:hypothetical protein
MAAKAVTFAAVNNAQRRRVRWVEKGEWRRRIDEAISRWPVSEVGEV